MRSVTCIIILLFASTLANPVYKNQPHHQHLNIDDKQFKKPSTEITSTEISSTTFTLESTVTPTSVQTLETDAMSSSTSENTPESDVNSSSASSLTSESGVNSNPTSIKTIEWDVKSSSTSALTSESDNTSSSTSEKPYEWDVKSNPTSGTTAESDVKSSSTSDAAEVTTSHVKEVIKSPTSVYDYDPADYPADTTGTLLDSNSQVMSWGPEAEMSEYQDDYAFYPDEPSPTSNQGGNGEDPDYFTDLEDYNEQGPSFQKLILLAAARHRHRAYRVPPGDVTIVLRGS